ncbi:hypothetical protein ACGFMM_35680 [Streptomyces sp. NPDC048604]|uniref:hypothetical protein n=1 Tax=Streptomyces sp. NPDC048604 TaxID=3365578 RepID=UPI0037201C7C
MRVAPIRATRTCAPLPWFAAYRIIRGERSVVEELARERADAKAAEARALAGLKQAAVVLVSAAGSVSGAGFARGVSVDGMAVRSWFGRALRADCR